MPVKRRAAKARDHRITPAAIAAFRAGDWIGLHRALGLKPWEASPLREPTSTVDRRGDSPWTQSLPQAAALRRQLEEEAR